MQHTRYRSIISLRKGQSQCAGRNSQGKITVRHRGGGHKQAFRKIDWNRNNSGIITAIEYDPQRNASIIKLYHSNIFKKYSYVIAPTGIQLFQELFVYKKDIYRPTKLLQPGDKASISFFEPGDFIHGVESFPNQGAIFGRSAGSFCQIISMNQKNIVYTLITKSNFNYAKIRLPSGQQRVVDIDSQASFGIVGISKKGPINLKKAGRSRWLGWRPSVRGVAINPVDHPHGGGQGKTSGGRPSVTFKSWPTKGQPTRNPKRKNRFILKFK